MATLAQIAANGSNLSIPLYVKRSTTTTIGHLAGETVSLRSAWKKWQADSRAFWRQMDDLVETLDGLLTQEQHP